MLNAATATISVRMMNITRFSICTARKKLAWLRVQSVTKTSASIRLTELARHARRGEQVVELQAHAGDLVLHAVERCASAEVQQRQAGVVFVHADLEDADDRNCFRRGRTPPASPAPAARSASPCRHAHAAGCAPARSRARCRTRRASGCIETAPRMCGRSRRPLLGSAAAAHHQRAAHRLVEGQHALRGDVGRGARTWVLAPPGRPPLPVGQLAARTPEICTCEATPRMRVRSSFWKPFITDSTTISAATPSAMPHIEIRR
jgi:hypothetical protein